MNTPVHISVPTPCHEDWQLMTPKEQGRFCMSCQKTVVDFSLMSDQEVLQYFSTSNGNTCGHFSNDQLNKTYEDRRIQPAFRGWRYVWNMMVASFLLSANTASAQTGLVMLRQPVEQKKDPKKKRPALEKPPVVPQKHPHLLGAVAIEPQYVMEVPEDLYYFDFTGLVADSKTNQPISHASVSVKGEDDGIAADSAGLFRLKKKIPTRKLTIVVSAIGYESQEIEIDSLRPSMLNILLTARPDQLKEVAVIAYGTSTMRGGAMMVVRVSRIERTKREVAEWFTKNDVKVYPNPVVPGHQLTVSLNTKFKGNARIELLDAGGKLMWAQQVQNIEHVSNMTVPTQAAWSRGVYWLRLTAPQSKKVYNAKILLQ